MFRTPGSAEIPVQKRSNPAKDTTHQSRGRIEESSRMRHQMKRSDLKIKAGTRANSSLSLGEVGDEQTLMSDEQL